jgi:hypothetical protein
MPASFDAWVRAVFDHPIEDPEWFWQPGFDEQWEALGVTSDVTVAYLTTLYRDPLVLRAYSLDQVGQAIWFLVAESSPAQPSHSLLDPSIAIGLRIDCIRAIEDFFRQFVAAVAPGPADREKNGFHIACFMWWDIFPMWGDSGVGEPELKLACLDVMRAILRLPSDVCQLSALHGLTHWHRRYGRQAAAIIDEFLATEQPSASVRQYAAIARVGGWQ